MRPWLGLLSPSQKPLILAVSGGIDSMALAFLASRWTSVFALIVDHALRSESPDEAQITAERLAGLGIPSKIIRMNPQLYPKGTGTQERARRARFEVFHQFAKELSADVIALGHHQGDQDETLYMRWQKMSGKFGLGGISALVKERNLFILRPLLTIPRSRLEATLRLNKIDWCEDPSNHNRHYERVRVRQDISEDERKKMRSLAGLAQCNIVFERYFLFEVWKKYFIWHEEAGWAEILETFWLKVPKQIAITILRYVIQLISASPHRPSFEASRRLYETRFGTLGGVKLKKLNSKSGAYLASSLLVREMRGLPTLKLRDLSSSHYEISSLWAGSWYWAGEKLDDPELEIRPLGVLKEKIKDRDFPLEVAQSLPSLWKKNEFLGTADIKGLSNHFKKLPFQWSGNDFLDLIGIRKR